MLSIEGLENLTRQEIFKRVLSAILLFPVVIFAVWQGTWLFYIFLGLIFLGLSYEALKTIYSDKRLSASHRALHAALSVTIAGMFCLGLFYIRQHSINGTLLLSLAVFVFMVDTSAYIGGKVLRGPKFAPQISPKKTWAGTLSGLCIGGILGTPLFMAATKVPFENSVILAFTLAAAAILGDLIISAAKRFYAIKDASSIIPGHGGLWDRADSFLIVVSLVCLLLFIGAL